MRRERGERETDALAAEMSRACWKRVSSVGNRECCERETKRKRERKG